MTWMPGLRARWRLLFARPAAEERMDEEIRFHIEMETARLVAEGVPPEEARRRALVAFGGVEKHREEMRAGWRVPVLEALLLDVRYAARSLRRTPGFTLAVVLTIGVAVAGNGAVFSLVDAVLFDPLPYAEPGRLVTIWENEAETGSSRSEVAPVNYALLSEHDEAFESVAAVAGYGATLQGDRPEKLAGRRVTHDFFDVLGVAPALGRGFRPEEDVAGAADVVVLSYGLWRGRFGGDPTILGREIVLDDRRFSVVGVMPAEFQFLGGDVGLWVPAAFGPQELANGANYLTLVARLKPTVTVAGAQASLRELAARLARDLPETSNGFRLEAVPLAEHVTAGARRPLVVLWGAVGVIMLIACANVANLLLARATARRNEFSLRTSLGATRGRIVRQLLAESLVLCALGLLAGVALARGALAFLSELVPMEMALFARPTLDARVLGFTVLASLTAGVLFGLVPALHVGRADHASMLRRGGRGVSGAEAGRGALAVGVVAMTLVLMVVAGLLMQTLYRLRYADVGFRPEGVVTLRTALPSDRYPTHARRVEFYDEVLERIGRLPGVVGAGYTTSVPLAWKGASTGFAIEGAAPEPGVDLAANLRQVSTDYLRTIGTPLLEGRAFGDADQQGSQPVAIVNETMARRYWPDGKVIGQRLRTTDDAPDGDNWLTVVGVVGDVHQMGLDQPANPELYVPYRQFDEQPWFAPRDLAVRVDGGALELVGAMTREIHAVDAALPVSDVRLMTGILDDEVATRRIGTVVLVAFAAFAVLIAVVGIYGVIAYFVVQRTSEIGVRIALGAQAGDILRLVVGRGVKLTLLGVGIGTVGAIAATRFVASLLYGFSGFDPTVVIVANVLLVSVALVASYVPARRVARLDAIAAIRSQ